ncbi:GtrA family protein [Parahaliea maris]|nr:GtrA family protein [Parahaliea maris]
MSNKPSLIDRCLGGELLRFAIVGAIATAVHVFFYLSLYPALVARATTANLVAFSLAVLVSYAGNSRWVFRDTTSSSTQLVKFIASALTGVTLNTFFAWYIVDYLKVSRYLSVVVMITTTPIVVFVLNKYFVFTGNSSN